jgi:hypothetical protein
VAMMGEEAGAALNGPGTVDPLVPPGDPLSAREELAGELEGLSPELRKTHRRLTKTAPASGTQMAFWEQGLEDIQGHLDDVAFLLTACERLLESEKKDAARKAPAPGSRQPKPDNLAKALERLDDAITLAFEKANAARSSLEMTDQAFSAESRSSDFVKAAAQIKELAGFREATAVQLRGPAALVRRARDAQE